MKVKKIYFKHLTKEDLLGWIHYLGRGTVGTFLALIMFTETLASKMQWTRESKIDKMATRGLLKRGAAYYVFIRIIKE